ncbi:carboxypeptidase-like regulatory domain-containing protein [Flavobacterium sp.]|uniref:carboxypeptidase-like regulatory domain-containing protein n=1 Tax=Flavobacterium sp. TaxID=239 RepID=UPI0026265A37|nr:carboxypeptidase-like regulatory domain-containing protein [Flavobacterium sp.]
MSQKINISIPEPCHENWQKMSPTEKGRFCDSCQKKVFDFTNASDRQIISAYNKNSNLCGRFLNTQLDRDLVAPKEKSTFWMATTSTIISFFALGSQESIAQEAVKTEQTDQKIISKSTAGENDAIEGKTITGIVTDSVNPWPGISIVIKGTQKGTTTNFDGLYSIKAKEGDVLVFHLMGLEEKEITIGNDTIYNVIMKDDPKLAKDKVIYRIGGICGKRQNFFRRTFHSIGNWFK